MGNVRGLFTATPEQLAAKIGKHLYFGEILGKHSDIYGDLAADEVTESSSDPAVVAWFDAEFPFGFGHHPFSVEDEDDTDGEEDDESEED